MDKWISAVEEIVTVAVVSMLFSEELSPVTQGKFEAKLVLMLSSVIDSHYLAQFCSCG